MHEDVLMYMHTHVDALNRERSFEADGTISSSTVYALCLFLSLSYLFPSLSLSLSLCLFVSQAAFQTLKW